MSISVRSCSLRNFKSISMFKADYKSFLADKVIKYIFFLNSFKFSGINISWEPEGIMARMSCANDTERFEQTQSRFDVATSGVASGRSTFASQLRNRVIKQEESKRQQCKSVILSPADLHVVTWRSAQPKPAHRCLLLTSEATWQLMWTLSEIQQPI